MPQLTLNFKQYTPNDQQYGVQAWITHVTWRDAGNVLITTGQGVYIIDNGAGPVYAGQADSFRDRFDGRSGALNEFMLTAAVDLPGYTVYTSSVVANPATLPYKIDWAEAWLIRFLYLRDQGLVAHQLQNINYTGPLQFTIGATSIRFNPATAPAYLIGGPGYVVINAASVGYNYAANYVL